MSEVANKNKLNLEIELLPAGDGGFWLENAVTPIFLVLAHEVRLG